METIILKIAVHRPTTLERAFDLARSGRCRRFDEIRHRLKREGFFDVESQLFGTSIRRQLNALCAAACGSGMAKVKARALNSTVSALRKGGRIRGGK